MYLGQAAPWVNTAGQLLQTAADTYGAFQKPAPQYVPQGYGPAYAPAQGGPAPTGSTGPVQSVNQNVTVQASSPGATTGATSASSTMPTYGQGAPYYDPQVGYYAGQPNLPYVPYGSSAAPQTQQASMFPISTPVILIFGGLASLLIFAVKKKRGQL